jgi:hypothetical protein
MKFQSAKEYLKPVNEVKSDTDIQPPLFSSTPSQVFPSFYLKIIATLKDRKGESRCRSLNHGRIHSKVLSPLIFTCVQHMYLWALCLLPMKSLLLPNLLSSPQYRGYHKGARRTSNTNSGRLLAPHSWTS